MRRRLLCRLRPRRRFFQGRGGHGLSVPAGLLRVGELAPLACRRMLRRFAQSPSRRRRHVGSLRRRRRRRAVAIRELCAAGDARFERFNLRRPRLETAPRARRRPLLRPDKRPRRRHPAAFAGAVGRWGVRPRPSRRAKAHSIPQEPAMETRPPPLHHRPALVRRAGEIRGHARELFKSRRRGLFYGTADFCNLRQRRHRCANVKRPVRKSRPLHAPLGVV
mmetsp:Transcript_957/g.3071  ORF Transcript_957/g.3071 Transcript_957/m.3071 type:complete len:221 (-) Transcript_957:241-903(-)